MAIRLALISFEFDECKGLRYDPRFDHDLEASTPRPGESIQPVIDKAFRRIQRSLAVTLSQLFHYGYSQLSNVNNFMHLGIFAVQTDKPEKNGPTSATSILFVTRFYRLKPLPTYKVTIDIEEMPNSSIDCNINIETLETDLIQAHIERLSKYLDHKFNLNGRIEYSPIITRGYYDFPRLQTTSDKRLVEYDFNQLICHVRSKYQDIKIVSSKTLGNSLLLNDKTSVSESDDQFIRTLMDKNNLKYDDKRVLILGGGDGTLFSRVLGEPIKYLRLVEIDLDVIGACSMYMRSYDEVISNEPKTSDKARIINDDCQNYLRNCFVSGDRYDIIFNDLSDKPFETRLICDQFPTTRVGRWFHLEPIMNLAIECLVDGGSFVTKLCSPGDLASIEAFEDLLRHMPYELELMRRATYIPSRMELLAFYTIKRLGRKQTNV